MMLLKAGRDHLSSVMCKINNFREESSLCDIVLMIDNQRLQAHRCVLAAGSPYFNALLNGQFTEAKMKEVNLSKVTTDFTALDRVVKFIYTSEIDFDEDHLAATIKLSSFFMIESLRNICCTFMTKKLSLDTCLRYYFYSKDHSLTTMESKSWHLVRSRFHDYLTYEDATQFDISPDEMEHLVERNVFQHCSDVSIVRFTALWVNKGLTEGHVLIAKEIIENVMQRDISPDICVLHFVNELSQDSLYKKLESALRAETTCIAIKSKNLFSDLFKQVLENISIQNEVHIFEMSSQLHADGKETAIITVCPSKGTIEYTYTCSDDKNVPVHLFSSTDPIFEVFVYVPRTRCWYRLPTINFINEYNCLDAVVSRSHFKMHKFHLLNNELVLSEQDDKRVLVYDLTTLENGQSEMVIDYSFLRPYNFCLAAGKNNSRYAVVVHSQCSRMFYLAGYKAQNDGKTWQEQFKTKQLKKDISSGAGDIDLYAKISTVSNEMLVVCSTNKGIVFVIDLNEDNSSLVTPLATVKHQHFDHINILETTDVMYIVTGGSKAEGRYYSTHTKKAMVNYEYKLRSKQLEKIHSTAAILCELDKTRKYRDTFPCISQASTYVDDGLWYMEGNADQASSLTKVSVDKDKNPVLEHHTPPPFHRITAMVAGRISCRILENKKPITQFFN